MLLRPLRRAPMMLGGVGFPAESDVVRVIDLLDVHKGADGVVRRLHHSDVTAGEAEGAGAVVGALIGLVEDEDAAVPDG